ESPYYWIQLRNATWGTGQPNVNATSLSELIVPLPPLAEQRVWVLRVEKILAMIDGLEAQVKERKVQVERVLQVVLGEAFEGGRCE
ncbi:MAG: restriction endonuclease subunit S, partial [Prevotella sp.]|nr:restriction endonuclease subunit S [Prevotella sp.]